MRIISSRSWYPSWTAGIALSPRRGPRGLRQVERRLRHADYGYASPRRLRRAGLPQWRRRLRPLLPPRFPEGGQRDQQGWRAGSLDQGLRGQAEEGNVRLRDDQHRGYGRV